MTVLGDFPAELLARIAFSSSDETVFTVGSDGSLILTGAGTANLTVSLSVGTDVYRYTKSITVEISEDLPADSTAPEEENAMRARSSAGKSPRTVTVSACEPLTVSGERSRTGMSDADASEDVYKRQYIR